MAGEGACIPPDKNITYRKLCEGQRHVLLSNRCETLMGKLKEGGSTQKLGGMGSTKKKKGGGGVQTMEPTSMITEDFFSLLKRPCSQIKGVTGPSPPEPRAEHEEGNIDAVNGGEK